MTIIAIILTALSILVVVGNIYGCISARLGRKKGIDRGYSKGRIRGGYGRIRDVVD